MIAWCDIVKSYWKESIMFDGLRENFELLLVVLFIISTICYVLYRLTIYGKIKEEIKRSMGGFSGMRRRQRKELKNNVMARNLNNPLKKFIYFFADLFWVLFFVVVVRSFLFEPFIIPSGSMKPGLQVGDIVLVNKFKLGFRMPITNERLTNGMAIKRGDVIVFRYPKNPKISYIKRVIGLPGDKVYYDNRQMTINGETIKLEKKFGETDSVEIQTPQGVIEQPRTYTVYEETLPAGATHTMRYSNNYPAGYPEREWTVPEGQYLVMGDNRDNSADGRDFGFLEDKYLIGQATRIAFNFDCIKGDGKCDRFFKEIR